MRAATTVLIATLALGPSAGCGGCGADGGDGEPDEPGAQQAAGGESGGREPGGEGDEAQAGPTPAVRVAAEPADIERGFIPIVQSRGDDPAKLARTVTVEREKNGGWSKVATVSLRFSCDEPAKDECITLVPGAELRPPPWRAMKGDRAQCDGEGEPAPAGTYRFVAESCDGAHRLAGQPFER